MKKQTTLVLTVVVLILVAFVGYVYAQKQLKKNVAVSPVSSLPSGWKVTKNEVLGIELSYPEQYKVVTQQNPTALNVYYTPQPIEFGPQFSVMFEKPDITSTTNDNKYLENYLARYKNVTERGMVTINGVEWTKIVFVGTDDAGPAYSYSSYHTLKNGFVYSVVYTNTATIDTKFQQMMNTIRFIR